MASLRRAFGPIRPHLPLLRDIGLTSGARVYSALLGIVALSLTARWLGPAGRGVAVVVTTWVTMVSSIAYLSLGQVCVHRAANEENSEWIGPTVAALLMIAAAMSIAGWVAAAAFYALAGPGMFKDIPVAALMLGMAALPFLIWEQYGSALLTILGRLGVYNFNQIVARSLGLVILFVTIRWLGLGFYGFLIAFVVTQMIVSSAGAAVILDHCRGKLSGGLARVGALVGDGLKIHLNAIGVILFTGVDILMLQYFRGPAEAALFQLPMQLFLALLIVPQSALLALNGRIAGLSRVQLWHQHRMIIGLVVAAMALGAAMLWLLAPLVIGLIGSARFAGSSDIFRILIIGLPGAAFNTLMGLQWITRGYFLRASLLTFAAGLANVAFNLVLIPRFGAHGAAVATVAGLYIVPVLANLALAVVAEREARAAGAANG